MLGGRSSFIWFFISIPTPNSPFW